MDSNALADDEYAKVAQTRSAFPQSSLLRPGWKIYKRLQDFCLAIAIVFVLCVPMLVIAFLIKRDSDGPVLFLQQRRGVGGHLFTCFKFRTMHACFADRAATLQSQENDFRITQLGLFLRRTSLDELPQIFNVLLGNMSIIGPRPHATGTAIDGRLLPDVSDDYMTRYTVKPGITGWAQVNGWRGILDTEEKLQRRLDFDFYYIHNWSPVLDLRILLKTVACVFDKKAF